MSHPRRHLKPLSLLLALGAVLLGHPFPAWSGSESDPGPWPKILSTELVMDREYQEQSRKDRNFTPVPPFSPFDTFNVVAKAQLLCQWKPGDSGRAGLLWIYGFRATLMTTDTQGHEVAIASARVGWVWDSDLEQRDQRDASDTYGTYVAQFAGWPNGLAQGEQLELLIDSIAAGRRVWVQMQAGTPDDFAPAFMMTSTSFTEDKDVPMTNCVRLRGSGSLRIVTGRLDAEVPPTQLIAKAEQTYQEGFRVLQPFRSSLQSFTHLVDLKNLDVPPQPALLSVKVPQPQAMSCDAGLVYALYSTHWVEASGERHDAAGFNKNSKNLVFMHLTNSFVFMHPTHEPQIAMHEFGHAIGNLQDESVYPALLQNDRVNESTNCAARDPETQYCYQGRLYGVPSKGCTDSDWAKPSPESFMNDVNVFEPNVISCGYLLKAIHGNSAKSYFPECMAMDDVVKPPTPLKPCSAQ